MRKLISASLVAAAFYAEGVMADQLDGFRTLSDDESDARGEVSVSSYATDTSSGTLVYLRPELSSFWHTVTNRTMTLPVDFPPAASTATLTVTGAFGYTEKISDITTPFVTVTLPAAAPYTDAPATEDVFDFTLTFDDGTVRSARLGLISGLGAGGEGATRCLAPATNRKWSKMNGCIAVPVPYGMKSLEIGGVVTNTGLNGAQGWFPLKVQGGTKATLTGVLGEDVWTATLSGAVMGFFVFLR